MCLFFTLWLFLSDLNTSLSTLVKISFDSLSVAILPTIYFLDSQPILAHLACHILTSLRSEQLDHIFNLPLTKIADPIIQQIMLIYYLPSWLLKFLTGDLVILCNHIDFVVVFLETRREKFEVIDNLSTFDNWVLHAHVFDVERSLFLVVMFHTINIFFMSCY